VIATDEVPDPASEASGRPEVILVEVTVLPDPDARSHREWIAAFQKVARWPAVLALALGIAILATAVMLPGDPGGTRHVVSATARDGGPAGVAAAHGYPLLCLSITTVGAGHRYARADFNRVSRCERFTGYPTATFLRVMGASGPVLKAVAYVCRVASLPAGVGTELDVCLKPGGQSRRTRIRYRGGCPPDFERCRLDQAEQELAR
jgi:hypothetical protein